MSENFIKLTKKLSTNDKWLNARPEHQAIFIAILMRCAWKTTTHDIRGQQETILIGQICASIRKIGEWTSSYTNKNEVVAFLSYFRRGGFLRHELRQGKTLITIIDSDVYDTAFGASQTQSQTKSRQNPDTKKIDQDRIDIDLDQIDLENSDDGVEKLTFDHKKNGTISISLEKLIQDFVEKGWTEKEISKAIEQMKKQNPSLNGSIDGYLEIILKNNNKEKQPCKKTSQEKKSKSDNDKGYFLGDDLSEAPLAKFARQNGLK